MSAESIHERFLLRASLAPAALAVTCGHEQITYGGLAQLSGRIAATLVHRGIGRGSLVGVCLHRSCDLVATLLGILRTGAAYLPLDPLLPATRLNVLIANARPSFIVTSMAQSTCATNFACSHELLEKLVADPGIGEALSAKSDSRDHCYVVYTSGSTGQPKGVTATHGAVVNYLDYIRTTFDLGPRDVVAQLPSFTFDASVRDLFGALTAGASVFMLPGLGMRDPRNIMTLFSNSDVTAILSITPSLLRTFLQVAPANPTLRLRVLLVSGEALSQTLSRRAKAVLGSNLIIANQYGPTECTMTSTYHLIGDEDGDLVPLGRPIPGCELLLLDETGGAVEDGAAGEIYIGGRGVSPGYLHQPELTAERFVPHPQKPLERIYRTGDLAWKDLHGRFHFIGRCDREVKIRGNRVAPEEIETATLTATGVRRAVTLIHKPAGRDPELALYVTTYDAGPSPLDIKNHLKSLLPDYMIPAVVRIVDDIPLTDNGKVDRHRLSLQLIASGEPQTRSRN